MSNHNKKPNDMFEIILEDIREATDEEILNEAIEDGIDVKSEVQKMKSFFEKCRYNIAKKMVNEKDSPENKPSRPVSIEDARKKIETAVKNNPEKLGEFTLAARSGKDIPDEDILGLYDDLCDLDVFDEDESSDKK
ncbi:hypothetical protein [Desulfobacula toluolica]|uniref:Uncharacterized protein n=1 Tax=Desulfobacula toluolica (strain DSM 7467 / Tol2) TaxID=651182 RepID=K0N9V3_DESTT|nr:hypothetical protein [Desulfobacula toluolica]CCK80769.1 uncharacterized protein TOL2_C26100 [Desulfobacula toluolica Tol2]